MAHSTARGLIAASAVAAGGGCLTARGAGVGATPGASSWACRGAGVVAAGAQVTPAARGAFVPQLQKRTFALQVEQRSAVSSSARLLAFCFGLTTQKQ